MTENVNILTLNKSWKLLFLHCYVSVYSTKYKWGFTRSCRL